MGVHLNNYPPQSGNFIGSDDNDYNVVDTNIGALRVTALQSYENAGAYDAFGRSRTSVPFTLNDYKHIYGIDPNMIVKIAGTGATIVFQPYQAAALLNGGTGSTGSAIHQTKMYHNYMPGKSQLTLSTFNFQNGVTFASKRTGYYDDKNGVFLDLTGTTLSFNVRTYVTGSASTTSIPQTQWNKDTCNGAGPSGFNLNISKTQLWFTDFQWLGVGRIRFGFYHDGQAIVAHEVYNSNNLALPFMSNPNLPVRCEVVNTATSAAGTSMLQICSTVISEGGYVEAGSDWSASNFSGATLPATAGTSIPVIAIRLKNSYKTYENRGYVRLGTASALSSASNIAFSIYKLASSTSVTGGTWTAVSTDSICEYNSTATSINFTGAEELATEFIAATSNPGGQQLGSSGSAHTPASAAKKNFIAQNYDSTDSEIFVLVARNLSATATTINGTVQWREVF